ncbi:relaxase/mobilization nuclease (plasmid) [Deinococcus peraridilitoris DSM 19664]|uniref:Relaxase/mobilization nuclease n=1 Tax=Deinococcus peraridilitoris (strain DSM 19664 / LMG 22246 / CIP 109416 / KR-200) TaxID=937777 RepID=L0A6F0_DEIPD|nr:relaxase/mobilization nuclease [Deinococcus peraridilitoris DSM 19664]
MTPQGSKTRTVVKAKYTRLRSSSGKLSRSAVGRVKDSAEYYAHRPNAEGQRAYRAGFNGSQDELTKYEVAQIIEREGEKWDLAYRMVLSPGEEMGKEDIREWTKDVMKRMGFQDHRYVAFAHAGEDRHTDNAHVHVIAFTDEKLGREQLRYMREVGDFEADSALRKALMHELKHRMERTHDQGMDIKTTNDSTDATEGGGASRARKRNQQMDMDF